MIKDRHKWILDELKELKSKGLISRPRKRSSKGYANFPIKWSVEGHFKDYGIDEVGVRIRAFMSYEVDGLGGIVLIDNEARNTVRKNLLLKALMDAQYVTWRKSMADKYGQMLLDFSAKKLSRENVEKASKKELMQLYNEFRDIYTKYEFYNNIWFFISDDLLKIVVERLERRGCRDFEEIEAIKTCSMQSFANRENIELLEAVCRILEDANAKQLVEANDFEAFKATKHFALLKKLAENHFWIPFNHVGPETYDEIHYFSRVRELILSKKDARAELEKARNFYPEISRKQEELFARYALDEKTKRLVHDLHVLSIMQDERKELIARSHFNWVNNLMGRIGGFFNLNPQQAAELYPEIIEKCLLNGIVDLDLFEKERASKQVIKITEPDGYTVYFDEDMQVFLDIILQKDSGEVRGTCACRGYAKGRVKVLRDANDGHKMEKGDILVTTMTTPDFLPYMRRAAAIVTDEGGVTCHAAIVSREFGIPCVIGTNNATEVLKDGDVVEVDAEKGIVKKL